MASRTACSLLALLLGGMATAQTPAARPTTPSIAAWPIPPVQLGQPQRMMPMASTTLPPFAQQPPAGAPLPPRPGGVTPPEQGLELENLQAPYTIQLEPPGLERLAQALQSDEQLKERIRQENRERRTPERVSFPADPVLSRDTYHGRKFDPMNLEVAPYYVCHGRLRFQQINAERYGWDLGVLGPVVSGGLFFWDVVTLPYHLAMEPCRCFEYNTGWCLPGDPVPLLLYPPELSATGAVAEVAAVLTLVACFP
jgi:hypothetical protein